VLFGPPQELFEMVAHEPVRVGKLRIDHVPVHRQPAFLRVRIHANSPAVHIFPGHVEVQRRPVVVRHRLVRHLHVLEAPVDHLLPGDDRTFWFFTSCREQPKESLRSNTGSSLSHKERYRCGETTARASSSNTDAQSVGTSSSEVLPVTFAQRSLPDVALDEVVDGVAAG
jgi:hypothetical protein